MAVGLADFEILALKNRFERLCGQQLLE